MKIVDNNVRHYRSNYSYSPLLAKLIEVCYETPIIRLKELAKLLGISTSYVHNLIERLKKDIYFKIWAVPYHDRIKLRLLRCFLQVKSVTHRQLLLEFLSRHDFVAYVAQCFGGSGKGVWCDFLVPEGREKDFVSFLKSLQNYELVNAYVFRTTVSLKNVVMGFEWYDFSTHTWCFNWQALLKDVLSKIDSQKSQHYCYNPEPPILSSKFDFYDLFILHYLEQNVFTPLNSLISKLGTTPQNLSYHFRNHVLRGELIRTTRPYWYPFLFEESSPYILSIEFEDIKKLNGFLEAIHRKPLAHTCAYYEQTTHSSVTLTGFLPYGEFFNFVNFLDSLKDYGIVKHYNFYIPDVRNSYVKSLPYHCYDEAIGWRFGLEPYLENLLKVAKKAQEGGIRSVAKFTSVADSKIESV